jgi:adenylate kinase family enzyme
MRISIIGHAGSGKSTLARMIGGHFGIPHIQIDRFWFEAGGVYITSRTPAAEKERIRAYLKNKVQNAIAAESWVSDGTYPRVQPDIATRADVLIFLDIPLWRRLLNHAQRMCRPEERHGELRWWHEISFFGEIVRRTYANRPKLEQISKEFDHKLVILRSRAEIDEYFEQLKQSLSTEKRCGCT